MKIAILMNPSTRLKITGFSMLLPRKEPSPLVPSTGATRKSPKPSTSAKMRVPAISFLESSSSSPSAMFVDTVRAFMPSHRVSPRERASRRPPLWPVRRPSSRSALLPVLASLAAILEALPPTAGVHYALLARIERVALRAEVHRDRVPRRGARLELVATHATHQRLRILWMYTSLHHVPPSLEYRLLQSITSVKEAKDGCAGFVK